MKRFFCVFFGSLGVIFFLLLISIGYLVATNAYGIQTILFSSSNSIPTTVTPSTDEEKVGTSTISDPNPLLTPQQEQALESVGIDPTAVPSKITPEQEACFVSILGGARVAEIKAEATPTATEFFRAKSCIQ